MPFVPVRVGRMPFRAASTPQSELSRQRRIFDFVNSMVDVNGDFLLGDVTIGRGHGRIESNAAFGRDALKVNTTGANNTAVGINTLLANTTGSSNVAIGLDALKSNTTGTSNIIIGPLSGDAITTGSDNIAIGSSALTTLTTANGNIAIGLWALRVCDTGTENIAIGFGANQQTTGDYNSSFGSQALTSTTTGGYNCGFGNLALGSNNTGSKNVALGFEAGRYHDDGSTLLATPENSVYIGAESKGKDNSDDNSIVIGYQALGEGANKTVIGNSSTTDSHIFGTLAMSAFVGTATLDDATGNEVAFTLNYTVNKATSGNDTGLLISMTDTASPGTSLPLDIQADSTSVFNVDESGYFQVNKIAESSTGETLAKFTLSDAADAFISIVNNTSGNGDFNPAIRSQPQTGDRAVAFQFIGQVDASDDTGSKQVVEFQARRSSGSAVTNRVLFNFANYSTSVMQIDKDGFVGLGVQPASELHIFRGSSGASVDSSAPVVIDSDGHNFIQLAAGTSSWAGVIFGDSGDNNIGRIYYRNDADSMHFFTNAAEAITISSTQQVGICTTANASHFEVDGSHGRVVENLAAATLTLDATMYWISVDYTSTGAVTITLPSATSCWNATDSIGREYTIADTGFSAGTNSITVNRAGSDTIIVGGVGSSETSVVLSGNGDVIRLKCISASKWMVF